MKCKILIRSKIWRKIGDRRLHDFDRQPMPNYIVPDALYLELNARTPSIGNNVIDRQGRHLISTRMTSISVRYLNVGRNQIAQPCINPSVARRLRCAADVSRWLSSVKKEKKKKKERKEKRESLTGDKAALGLMEIEKCKEPGGSSS